jgi:uncharacterized membrane protein YjjP (DUF1212 family)
MGQRQSEIIKNHMEVYWHDYASASKGVPITEAGLVEKASVIGRTGLMLLECGTGAWRVRSSMNTLSRELGVTTTADIGLLSIEFTCFDGDQCYTQSLCLTNTGVNTSRLNRLEHFVNDFDREGKFMTGEELHSHLDEIERIHGLYSPIALGFAAALACSCFTFLLGGGIVEMLCAFCGAGIGNFVRCKLTKHHFTLFLGITASVCSASLVYAILLKLAEVLFAVSAQHEAGYICSMLFIIPGFPFITSGIDLAKLDMRSGLERLAYAVLIILVATMTAWIMALLLHLQPVQFPEPDGSGRDRVPAAGKFWRCVRLFAHVQQSPELGSLRRPYRCGNEHVPAGAGEPCGLSARCCSVSGRTAVRTAGLLPEERRRLSSHLRHRAVHRYHGTGTVFLPCHL